MNEMSVFHKYTIVKIWDFRFPMDNVLPSTLFTFRGIISEKKNQELFYVDKDNDKIENGNIDYKYF